MAEAAASPRLKLILVDDHDAARLALARRLGEDARVDVVESTADLDTALEAVTLHRPHAALVDPRRRDGDGMDVVARLAQMPRQVRPVIAIHSAFLDAEEWLRARRAGAHDQILKQIAVDALVARLFALVQRELPPERWPSIP